MQTEKKQTISQFSRYAPQVRALLDKLISTEVGATVEYETLSEVQGSDVRYIRFPLMQARKRAEAEYNAVFETINKVGLKRVNDSDRTDMAGRQIRLGARKYRKAGKLAAGCDLNKLDPTKRQENLLHQCVANLVAMTSSAPVQRRLQAAQQGTAPMSLQAAIDFFKDK